MATLTPADPQRVAHTLPLLRRWQVTINTCNCPDVEHADLVSRWLVIARACVFPMTLNSGIIGALLAAGAGAFVVNPLFSIFAALLCIVGLILAHATNNLVNDWTDVKKGVDTEDYPRAQYSTHPVLGGLTTPARLLQVSAVLTVFDGLVMLYLASVSGAWVIFFAVTGLVISLGYTIFLKRYALGELSALVVWGPLMIGGTFYAITGSITPEVLLMTLPYGVVVSSVLIGKHTDKISSDAPVGVRSVPVIIGERRSLLLNKVMFVLFYVLVAGLVLYHFAAAEATAVTGPFLLLTLLALPKLLLTWKAYSNPKPAEKPEDWPVWPLWYVAWAMNFNLSAGFWFVVGLFLNVLVINGLGLII